MVTSYLKMKGETMLRTVQCINMASHILGGGETLVDEGCYFISHK